MRHARHGRHDAVGFCAENGSARSSARRFRWSRAWRYFAPSGVPVFGPSRRPPSSGQGLLRSVRAGRHSHRTIHPRDPLEAAWGALNDSIHPSSRRRRAGGGQGCGDRGNARGGAARFVRHVRRQVRCSGRGSRDRTVPDGRGGELLRADRRDPYRPLPHRTGSQARRRRRSGPNTGGMGAYSPPRC